MPASIIDSPRTDSRNDGASPTMSVGSEMVSVMFSSARMGEPAATLPTRGTFTMLLKLGCTTLVASAASSSW